MEKNYNKTIVACFVGYIVQAIVNNFVPLLFLTFQRSYQIPLSRITLLVTINFAVQLLVDLLSKKLSGSLIERSEYPRIYEDVFRKYNIDETRMFRYAKRRHLYDCLLSFIKAKTDIQLMTI